MPCSRKLKGIHWQEVLVYKYDVHFKITMILCTDNLKTNITLESIFFFLKEYTFAVFINPTMLQLFTTVCIYKIKIPTAVKITK